MKISPESIQSFILPRLRNSKDERSNASADKASTDKATDKAAADKAAADKAGTTKGNTFVFKMPTITSMFSSSSEMTASRKNAALNKLKMLEQQLDGMMKFAGIGKGSVAAAARLAKQIAAAVAEYAGISGGAGGSATMAMPVVSSSADTSSASAASAATAATATAATASATAAASAAGAQTATPTPAATPEGTANAATENVDEQDAATEADAATDTDQADDKVTEPGDDEKKSSGPIMPQQGGMSAADKSFMELAKKIALKAKQLLAIEMATSKQNKKMDEKLQKEALQAMNESLEKATIALEQQGSSDDAPAVYAADGSSSAIQVSIPQISVMA